MGFIADHISIGCSTRAYYIGRFLLSRYPWGKKFVFSGDIGRKMIIYYETMRPEWADYLCIESNLWTNYINKKT